MAVNITDRSAVEALIREQIVSTIFQDAPKQSAFMGMARKLPNMTSKQTRIRVLDFLPTAYWVDGDTGMKQTSMQAWDNVYLTAAELAVIVPIPSLYLMMPRLIFWARLPQESMRQSVRESMRQLSLAITDRESGRQISLPWRVRLGTMFPHLPARTTTI